jgi:hypothetical protein
MKYKELRTSKTKKHLCIQVFIYILQEPAVDPPFLEKPRLHLFSRKQTGSLISEDKLKAPICAKFYGEAGIIVIESVKVKQRKMT